MKIPIKPACLTALPVEAVNLWLARHYPLYMGLPPYTSLTVKLACYPSIFLHYPAFLLFDWIDKFPDTHALDVFAVLAFIVIGYLDTVLLLIAVILGFRFLRWLARHSFRSTGATQH